MQFTGLFDNSEDVVLLENDRTASAARSFELNMAVHEYPDRGIVGNLYLYGKHIISSLDRLSFERSNLRPKGFVIGDWPSHRLGRVQFNLDSMP
jgi:GT2 family glycosyltransferase